MLTPDDVKVRTASSLAVVASLSVLAACAADGPSERTRSSSSGVTACGTVLQTYDGEEVYQNFTTDEEGECVLNQCTGLSVETIEDEEGIPRRKIVGLKYQCVELPSRYFATKWGLLTSGSGNAGDDRIGALRRTMGTGTDAPLRVSSNGATVDQLPVPGDEIDWNNPAGGAGHAALIVRRTAVGSNAYEYTVLEQNVCGAGVGKFRCSLQFGGGIPTVTCENRWTTWPVAGWVHVKGNTGAAAAPNWSGSAAAQSAPKQPEPEPEPTVTEDASTEDSATPPQPTPDASTPPEPTPDASTPPEPTDDGGSATPEDPPADEAPPSAGPLQGESLPPAEAEIPQDEQGGWPEPGTPEAEELEKRTEEAFLERQNKKKGGSEGCSTSGRGAPPAPGSAVVWLVGLAALVMVRRRATR